MPVNNKKVKRNKPATKQQAVPVPQLPATPQQFNIPIDLPKEPAYQYQSENYSRPKIFVATPCYVGQVHVKYMESVMALHQLLMQAGIGFEFFNIPFDSLIPRARNASITRFMASKDSTHLLFVDADIQFHPQSVLKMLKEDKDVIAGCYPKKAIDFEAVKENYSKTENQVELIQSAVKYAYNFKPQASHKIERGVVEILDAPTGFLMVKKKVFRQMIAQYPGMEYRNDVRAYQITPEDRFFDLFPSQVFDRRYLSEDYGFCRLWQKMGGTIFADLTVKLNHIGQFAYMGDPIVHLKHSKNVGFSDKPIEPGKPVPQLKQNMQNTQSTQETQKLQTIKKESQIKKTDVDIPVIDIGAFDEPVKTEETVENTEKVEPEVGEPENDLKLEEVTENELVEEETTTVEPPSTPEETKDQTDNTTQEEQKS